MKSVRHEIAGAVRAARLELAEARRALADFVRRKPRLIEARRRALVLELARHRANVRLTVDQRRQQIAAARRSLAEYITQQSADLKRHRMDAAAAMRAYTAHMHALALARKGKLDEAKRHLDLARKQRPQPAAANRRRAAATYARRADVWERVRRDLDDSPAALAAIRTERARKAYQRQAGPMRGWPEERKAHRLAEIVREATAGDDGSEALAAAGEESSARMIAAAQQAEARAAAEEGPELEWTVIREPWPAKTIVGDPSSDSGLTLRQTPGSRWVVTSMHPPAMGTVIAAGRTEEEAAANLRALNDPNDTGRGLFLVRLAPLPPAYRRPIGHLRPGEVPF